MNGIHARIEFSPEGDGPADWWVGIFGGDTLLVAHTFLAIEAASAYIEALVPLYRNGQKPTAALIDLLTINQ
jgi:hypothetical protein